MAARLTRIVDPALVRLAPLSVPYTKKANFMQSPLWLMRKPYGPAEPATLAADEWEARSGRTVLGASRHGQ
jgi:hypothetical protein